MNLQQLNDKWADNLLRILGPSSAGRYEIKPEFIASPSTGENYIIVYVVQYIGAGYEEVDEVLVVPVKGWIRDAGVETAYRWIFRMVDRELDRRLHGRMNLPALNKKWLGSLPLLFDADLALNPTLEAHIDLTSDVVKITIFANGNEPDVTEAEYMESDTICKEHFIFKTGLSDMVSIACKRANSILEKLLADKMLDGKENKNE